MAKPRDDFERDLIASGLKIVGSKALKISSKKKLNSIKETTPKKSFKHKVLWLHQIFDKHNIRYFTKLELEEGLKVNHTTKLKIIESLVQRGHLE